MATALLAARSAVAGDVADAPDFESDAAKNLGLRIEKSDGTMKIPPSMFTNIKIDKSCAISAWKRRLLNDLPPL